MVAFVRRRALLRGPFGGSRQWTVLWALLLAVRLVRRLTRDKPEVVLSETLRRGPPAVERRPRTSGPRRRLTDWFRMQVTLRNPKRTIEVAGPVRVTALLARLDINRESVLVIRNDTLVPGDEVLADTDAVEIRPVISGGAGERS